MDQKKQRQEKEKRTVRTYWYFLAAALLLSVAYGLRILDKRLDGTLRSTYLQLFRHLIQIGLLFVWMISIEARIPQRPVRRRLLAIGGLLGFWLFIRVAKWMLFPTDSWPNRYCWYAYYIPMVLIPLLGGMLVPYIGKEEQYKLPNWVRLLWIPAGVLIGLVLTNDLHQQVFAFPEGIRAFQDQYTYRPVYFLIFLWCFLWGCYLIGMLILKCRAPGKRRYQRLPVFVLVGTVLLSVAYCLRLVTFDLTAVDCVITVLLLESCIQSGLIRSNSCYGSLFHASTIAAQITDEAYQVRYRSAQAEPLTREQMQRAVNAAVYSHDRRLCSAPVLHGYVFWQEDLTRLHQYQARLMETGRQLAGANDLLRAELTLKEKQLHIEEKNRLYDRIAAEVAPQLRRLDTLLQEKEMDDRERLIQICIISAYIKRRSNLLLLAEKDGKIPASELELCVRESMENRKLSGMLCALDAECTGMFPAQVLVAAYDQTEMVLEQTFSGEISALLIRLCCKDGRLALRIQMDGKYPAPDVDTLPEGFTCIRKEEEDTSYLFIDWYGRESEEGKVQDDNDSGNDAQ